MQRDLQTILDAVLDGVIVLDRGGCIEQLNAEACRILETSIESAAGQSLDRLMGEDHALIQLVGRVLEEGRPAIEDEVSMRRRFEGPLVVDLAVSPLPGASGAVVVLRDRTILTTLQALVSQRHQLTSYGHIAVGIAHEVKNPLAGIRGAAELLELDAQDDRAKRTAQLIVRESDRITALIDELMVFARGDELKTEAVNVHRVLDGVLELVALEPLSQDVETIRAYDPSIPELEADADRLTQVFLNLVRNALQAMEQQDEPRALTIETRMGLDHRLSDADGRHVPTVTVTFRDTGPGVPDNDLDRLATPFFTTKVQGTGLGLAVSNHWITRHGGTLRITSPPAGGTQARVALPLRQPDSGDTNSREDRRAP